MAFCSPPKRSRSQEAALTEFCTSDGGTVVGEFSPCKPRAHCSPSLRALRPGAAMLAAFDGAAAAGAAGSAQHGSPTAVADMPAAPSTASQPSSATSSLAAALADLQVSSRQSSESDMAGALGDRAKLLAALGLPAAGAGPHGLHSRSSSEGDFIAAGPAHVAVPAAVAPEETLCSPHLIGAVVSFDNLVLKTLTPIKTRGISGSSSSRAGGEAGGQEGVGAAPASLAAAYPDSLVSPFHDPPAGMKPKQLQPLGAAARPMIYHTRSTSMTAPGAYNPYDLTAAALSSEFRSPAKSLHSPFPSSSSRGPSATATPSQWGSASYRASAYRMAAQQALAAQKDDEPDYYISVPGVRRQQSLARGNSNLSSVNSMGSATSAAAAAAAAAAVGAPAQQAADAPAGAPAGGIGKPLTPAQRADTAGRSLERQPTLGSGTTVHGFKGLFRSIIVSGVTSPPPGGAAR